MNMFICYTVTYLMSIFDTVLVLPHATTCLKCLYGVIVIICSLVFKHSACALSLLHVSQGSYTCVMSRHVYCSAEHS